jgi:glycosyltransferase involved in cell wall biosynthesis
LDLDVAQREIIVVNNGSRDQTESIARQVAGVEVLTFPWANRSRARNEGAKRAQGQWLAFIDADVELDSAWAKEMLTATKSNPALIYQGPIIPANTDGQESLNHYRYQLAFENTHGKFSLLFIEARESPMVNSAACLYQRELFLALGGFDELLERHEDIDLSKRASLLNIAIDYVPEARALVHYHDQGWPAYWSRAFVEGTTKIDYFAKWEGKLGRQRLDIEAGAKQWFKFDRFRLLKFIHYGLRALGRVIGHLSRTPRFTPLEKTTRLQCIERPD